MIIMNGLRTAFDFAVFIRARYPQSKMLRKLIGCPGP